MARPTMLATCLISMIPLLISPPPRSDDETASHPRIGVVTPEGPEGTRLAEVLKAEGEKRGYEILEAPPELRRQGQQPACQWLLEHQVQGLIARPASETGWSATLARAAKDGVPVVAIGSEIREEPAADGDRTQHSAELVRILPDFAQQGDAAGRWMLRNLPKGAGVVELRGVGSDTSTLERQGGFTGALAATRSLRLVATIAAGPDQASRLTQALDAKDSRIGAIFAHDVRTAKLAADPHAADLRIVWIDEGDGGPEALANVTGAVIECDPPVERVVFDALDRRRLGVRLPPTIQLRTVVIERQGRPRPKSDGTAAPVAPASPAAK